MQNPILDRVQRLPQSVGVWQGDIEELNTSIDRELRTAEVSLMEEKLVLSVLSLFLVLVPVVLGMELL